MDVEGQAAMARVAFQQTSRRERRNRKYDTGDDRVVGGPLLLRPMKKVRRDGVTVKGRDRREPWCAARRCVARRVDGGIRDALQVFVDDDAVRIPLDAGRIKIQVIDLGHAPGAVNDEIRFKLRRPAFCLGVDDERGVRAFDCRDGGTESHVNALRSRAVDEQVDQARIEMVKRTLPVVEDGGLDASAGRDVRKFERDVATADEEDPRRQRIEFQELLAGDEMPMALKGEIDRLGARRDEDVSSVQHVCFDRNRGGTDKAGAPVERRDARLHKSTFPIAGYGFDEAALEADEFRPVNPKILGAQAVSLQAVHLIERLGHSN